MQPARRVFSLGGTLLLAALVDVAQAAVLAPSDLAPGGHATQPGSGRPAALAITQSNDPNTVVSGPSGYCPVPGTQTHWWRLFDLDDDHGLTGTFCAETIHYAIEHLPASQTLTIRVHCLDQGEAFLIANLSTVGTVAVEHAPTTLTFHSADVSGCCDAETEDMAVQLSTEDIGFLVGCNVFGETGPTYVSASGADHCAIPEPYANASIIPHLIMVVTGTADAGAVPASSVASALVAALLVAAGGAWLLRRTV